MKQQVIDLRRLATTRTLLIFIAAFTPAGLDAAPEREVPTSIDGQCKASANIMYIRFHNQSLARLDYETCINVYRNLTFPGESDVPPPMRDMCKSLAIGDYVKFHDGVMAQVKYTTCISSYLFQGAPANPGQNFNGGAPASPSQSGSELKSCYLRCDEAERLCNKIHRFYPTVTPGGFEECAAERRSCDARCR